MHRTLLTCSSALFFWMASSTGRAQTAPPQIPLCSGLTIVTAVSQQEGDYESIKTVESVTDSEVHLKYSVERLVQDIFSNEKPKLQKYTLHRTIRKTDLASATLYEQQFSTELPDLIPETTAIGTSSAVLNALKNQGKSKLGIFITYTQIKPPIDRNTHPNVYDNQMIADITRADDKPVMIPVVVNDARVELPAIRATGDYFGDKTEFFFLDDPGNPLTLRFRYGIDAIKPPDSDSTKSKTVPARDRDRLEVTKIAFRCKAPESGPSALDRALSETGHADVYDIYFSFNSDQIRDESEPTLREIGDVLRKHLQWKLNIAGHTDSIGGDASNLDLSKRRAAAVKQALVSKFGVSADRLTTGGYGKSRPVDTNETAEGRARNRRVELARQ